MLTEEERIQRRKVSNKKYNDSNKEKTKLYNKIYRESNKETIKLLSKIYRSSNRDYLIEKKRKYNLDNKEALKEKCRIYYEKNKKAILKQVLNRLKTDSRAYAVSQSSKARYRARKRNAAPIWLTKAQNKEIIDIYKKCKDLTKSTGILYSVDHIIPLKNDLVCGLHVPWNLQIITASENSTKKNKLLQP